VSSSKRITFLQLPPEMSQSWLRIDSKSPFSLANIPFGIVSTSSDSTPRPAIAIGDYALDLKAFTSDGGFSALSEFSSSSKVFSEPTLNAFAALGRPVHKAVREYLQKVLTKSGPYSSILESNDNLQKQVLLPLKDVTSHLPLTIGDYTDFYAGRNHAYK
jgi:fumarylacetoacetase